MYTSYHCDTYRYIPSIIPTQRPDGTYLLYQSHNTPSNAGKYHIIDIHIQSVIHRTRKHHDNDAIKL